MTTRPSGSTAARPTIEASALVPSPCTNVCRMDPATGWCEGCLRTIDEIVGWSGLDGDGRLAVWEDLDRRRAAGREGDDASRGRRLGEAG